MSSLTTTRKQAPRLPRPAARYWKGKAPKGLEDVQSDSDEEEAPLPQEEGDVYIDDEQDFVEDEKEMLPVRSVPSATKVMNVALKEVTITKEGKVTVAGREESGRTALEEESAEEEESEEEKAALEDDEESTESSESEEEEKPKLTFRPVFIPKRGRVTVIEKETIAQESEEYQKKKELAAEERRKQSHDLVAESIKRELAEKEKEDDIPDVDDTDGLDPAGEFEAWRFRELARIKKEKEEEIRREEEREEIERRRALPEEQRLREDTERAKRLREEKPKGQQKFLQKYWHKGAFHQDEEILKRHDFTEATESTMDVSLLPQVMQVKNFGKRSRTKYTHLVDQDTTVGNGGFGGIGNVKSGGRSTEGGGCFICGGPHLKKDCPQNSGALPGARGGSVTGANAAPTGPRRWGDEKSWRDREDDSRGFKGMERQNDQKRSHHNDDRDQRSKRDNGVYFDDRNGRRRSRSRSTSPYYDRRRDEHYRRERMPSKERDRRDKRRRLD